MSKKRPYLDRMFEQHLYSPLQYKDKDTVFHPDHNIRRVLFIAFEFPPTAGGGVQRPVKFIKYLAPLNWLAIVLTPNLIWGFEDPLLLKDVPRATEIIRTKYISIPGKIEKSVITVLRKLTSILCKIPYLWRYSDLSKLSRSLSAWVYNIFAIPDGRIGWLPYAVKSGVKIVRNTNVDVMFSTSPPNSSHLVAYLIKKLTGVPWVADFRDEWTQNPFRSNPSGLNRKLNRLLEKGVLEYADKIVTTTPLMTQDISKLVNRPKHDFITITNGFDLSDFSFLDQKKHVYTGHLTITYVGQFYGDRSPVGLIKVILSLIERQIICSKEIRVVLVGRCTRDIESFKYDWLIMPGYVSHSEALRYMAESDVLLLISGLCEKRSYAGKLFEYLAIGKTIFALVPPDGATGRLLNNLDMCYISPPNDYKKIEDTILRIVDRWKKNELPRDVERPLARNFDREKLTQDLANIFDKLTSVKQTS